MKLTQAQRTALAYLALWGNREWAEYGRSQIGSGTITALAKRGYVEQRVMPGHVARYEARITDAGQRAINS